MQVTKEDCFAYREKVLNTKEHCDALYVLKCEGCKFYKTMEQYKADLKKYGMGITE